VLKSLGLAKLLTLLENTRGRMMIKNGDLPAMGNVEYMGRMHLDDKGMARFSHGLSKREHFAGVAIQGMLANPFWDGTPFSEIVQNAYTVASHALEGQQFSTQDNDMLEKATGCSMDGLDKLTVRGDS